MKPLIPLTAVVIATTAFAAEARTSSAADFRGYSACLEAVERDSNGLVPARHYYIQKDGSNAWYYINATRWQDGERDSVRIACETSARGHKLVSSIVEQGRFSQAPSARNNVEIAQK